MPDDETISRINRMVPSDLADDVLAAVEQLGGEAQRVDIIDRALDIGGWSEDERSVVSHYQQAARIYHLRTLADYAVTVCRDRGHLIPGDGPGRWELPERAGIEPHPYGRVFTAAVGLGDDPVPDDWSATDSEHIWLAQRSTQLSRGDHLFVLGAARNGAVLGLYEVTSAGTSTQPPNPWDPERWRFAVEVRPLAAVPPPEAQAAPGVTTPRGTANRIADPERQAALYRAVEAHLLAAAPTATREPARPADAIRQPRPFDPNREPTPAEAASTHADPAETEALREKARQGHHRLISALHAHLTQRGWSDLEEIPAAIDLRGRRPDGVRAIFEGKTITAENQLHQCRAGLAQLLEYRIGYGEPDEPICLVVDAEPTDERINILERLGVPVILVRDDEIRALNAAADALLSGTA